MSIRTLLVVLTLLAGCDERAGWCSASESGERAAFEARLREIAAAAPVELAQTEWARDMDPPDASLPRVAIGMHGVRWDSARPMLARFEADPDAMLDSHDPARWGELLPPAEGWLVVFHDGQVGDGSRGYLLPELFEALTSPEIAEAARPESTLLVVDRGVPFHTLARVLYTLGQAEHADLRFVVEHQGERELTVHLPVLHQLAQRDRPQTLQLTLARTEAGVVATGSGGRLEPGCETVGPSQEPTIAWEDLAALRTCLRRVRGEFPDDNQVAITADPEIEFERVAPLLAAFRADHLGPLFDEVTLSAGVR